MMMSAKGLAFVFAWMLVAPQAFADEKDPSADVPKKAFRVALSLDRVLFIGPFTQDGSRGESGIAVSAASFVKSACIDHSREPFVPHAIARLGVDVALPWGLTAGIAGGHGIAYETPDNDGYPEQPEDTQVATTVLQTRFGYVHPMKDAYFWFRTGFVYTYAIEDTASTTSYRSSIHHVSVPIDFVFVFPLGKHFGITYGWSADLGLYGVQDHGKTSAGRRVNDGVGMWFGVLGLL